VKRIRTVVTRGIAKSALVRRAVQSLVLLLALLPGSVVLMAPAAHAYGAWTAPRPNAYFNGRKCLDADLNTWYTNGGYVQIWDCLGRTQRNQTWHGGWEGYPSTAISTPPGGPGKCLDAWPDNRAPLGWRISVWDCNGQWQQQWDVSGRTANGGVSFRNIKWNQCLDIYTTAEYNGAPVTLRPCNGAAGQGW
jgi:hypothetical protein